MSIKGCGDEGLSHTHQHTHTHINMYRHICALPRGDMHIRRAAIEGRQHLIGSLIFPQLCASADTTPAFVHTIKNWRNHSRVASQSNAAINMRKGESASAETQVITSQWRMSGKMGSFPSYTTFSL